MLFCLIFRREGATERAKEFKIIIFNMKDDKEQILKDLIEHEPVRGRALRTASPSVDEIS